MKKLSKQQDDFCRFYLEKFNGTDAAIRAKYSKKTAAAQASRLLKMPKIQKRLEELRQSAIKRNDIEVDRVLQEYQTIAFSNITDFIERFSGRVIVLKSKDDIPNELLPAIQELSEIKKGVRIKLHSKVTALEALGRYLGMFEKDNMQKSSPIGELADKFFGNK